MEHLNKRKPNLLFFWFLLPFILYGGYAAGKLEGEQITIENVREMILYSLTHPWPLEFTLLTVKAVLLLLLIWVFGIIWYLEALENPKEQSKEPDKTGCTQMGGI